MGTETSARRRRRSKRIREENFPISKFGRCVVACAGGIKPAQWLASKARCSERNANFIIRGDQKPSFRAARAVIEAWDEF